MWHIFLSSVLDADYEYIYDLGQKPIWKNLTPLGHLIKQDHYDFRVRLFILIKNIYTYQALTKFETPGPKSVSVAGCPLINSYFL